MYREVACPLHWDICLTTYGFWEQLYRHREDPFVQILGVFIFLLAYRLSDLRVAFHIWLVFIGYLPTSLLSSIFSSLAYPFLRIVIPLPLQTHLSLS